MLVRTRGTLVRQRASRSQRSSKLSSNNVIRILSSLIIPLTLGLFTICITVFQHMSSQQDRLVDLRRADQERDKDIQRFELQRREDRNESRIQRDQELDIAMLRQDAQNKATISQYQDTVLKDYVQEIGDLMKENNGSLTSNPLIFTLAHVKTLNTLRQLDGSRQIHIIRFLHEIAKLTETDEFVSRIMSTADLSNVDFRHVTWTNWLVNMSFSQLNIRNCTFANNRFIIRLNFTSTRFDHVNFSTLYFRAVDFTRAILDYTNFSSADILDTNFSSVALVNVNSSFTNFTDVNFSSAFLTDVNFSSTRFNRSTFSFSKLSGINFSSAEFLDVDFSSVHLAGSLCNFRRAKMSYSVFSDCNCKMADFSYANLSGSVFSNANLKNVSFQNADLTRVNFSGANLCNADLTNTTISDVQLQSARSIYNAKLPNGTLGRVRNLLQNGNAHCHIPSLFPWHVYTGEISVVVSEDDRNDCRFLLQSHLIGAIMWQRVAITDIWTSNSSTNSTIELRFRRSDGMSLELYGRHVNGTVLQKEISRGSENKIMMKLEEGMEQVEVVVRFNVHPHNRYVWCDDIELFINYDMLERADKEYLKHLRLN